MTRYEIVSVREYTDKNGEVRKSYTKCGIAFPFRTMDGYSLQLEAMPAPQDGVFKLLMVPPRERDGQQNNAPARSTASHAPAGDIEDEIPF